MIQNFYATTLCIHNQMVYYNNIRLISFHSISFELKSIERLFLYLSLRCINKIILKFNHSLILSLSDKCFKVIKFLLNLQFECVLFLMFRPRGRFSFGSFVCFVMHSDTMRLFEILSHRKLSAFKY